MGTITNVFLEILQNYSVEYLRIIPEAYPEPCQLPKTECFEKVVNPLNIFRKGSNLVF